MKQLKLPSYHSCFVASPDRNNGAYLGVVDTCDTV